jgi:DNA-binding beta-propeller fold protein YncE
VKRTSVLWVLFVVAFVGAGGPGVSSGRAAGTAGVAAAGAPLRKIAEFELPGPPGKRFDYLTIDEDDNYLLSAHLGAGLLHVIDLKTNAVVKTVRDVPGVEGVAYISEGKKAYTANWGENKIGVIDLERMAVVKKLPTETKPDGIAYAAPFHKAYVSNERAKAESVIDVRTDTIVKVLRFDSETGVPQYDPVARKVYVNLQDQNVLAVIDPATDTVVGRYPVQGCRGNHGMAIDPEHRRAFLSCEGNDTLAVFDLDAHRAIAHLPMAKGADVVMFDPGLGRVYVACSSGAISVFQMDDPAHFRKLQDFPVEPKIHSLAVDPRTHRVYAPAEQEKGRPASKMFVFEAVTN